MKDAVLKELQSLSSAFSERPKDEVDIELKNGIVLRGKYDSFFNTVMLGGMTMPAGEVSKWTKLCWGSKVAKVVKKLSPVSTQAEKRPVVLMGSTSTGHEEV
jgi:hypothetical protein